MSICIDEIKKIAVSRTWPWWKILGSIKRQRTAYQAVDVKVNFKGTIIVPNNYDRDTAEGLSAVQRTWRMLDDCSSRIPTWRNANTTTGP
ncbi:hypothetical protein PHMEG_00010944 [Phytophthora megakarya]|uniref:Uncharacterized protein n=1 Tax=Phytophthora megakarya TaxID=4795 RepID=A0A225WCF8_9STRA|nr:hypothetical protein PHMEG_00010944 [Phytophthora megakarya]